MTNRRRFLGGAAFLATCGVRMGGAVEASDEERTVDSPSDGGLPIVDTHVHLWDLDRLRLPWLAGGGPLARNFLPDDYREAAEGLDVVKGVYMEVDVDPAQHPDEAASVVELCRRGGEPLVGAVIGGRPASDAFGAYLDRFRESPEVKGVRRVLHGGETPPGTCLQPEFVRGIRLLGDRGLSFDLCMRPGELSDGAKLVDACPETSFILDHCGNPDVQAADLSAWRDDLSRLADRENLVCKVSGIVASAKPEAWTPDDLAPIINHVLDRFGPDRVVFGGDWPVCTRAASLRQWIGALNVVVADRSLADRKKLFHDNAIRVYRLMG
ncbi:amidohydrolase [Tautonia sp. JC769]|uniref:amidohydrolase family protein n=1 Tax=Tautonia sp. JC769 TaxID=3232135 RepID=UPI00345758A5